MASSKNLSKKILFGTLILLGVVLFIRPQLPLILDLFDILSGRGTIVNSDKSVLEALAKSLDLDVSARPFPFSAYLEDRDGTKIPLKGYSLVINAYALKIPESDSNKIDEALITDLNNKTMKSFLNNSFDKYKNMEIREADILVLGGLYSKENIRCVAKFTLHLYGEVVCGVYNKEQDLLDKEFAKNIKPELESAYPDGVFGINKIDGNYAQGEGGFRSAPTGYAWIAMKQNGHWTIIWRGQQSPACKDIDKYNVPVSIYGNCY